MTKLTEVLQFISQCDESERDQVINALNTQRRVKSTSNQPITFGGTCKIY
jgi:hypothetical protein